MMKRGTQVLVWLAISAMAGAGGSYFFGIDFWVATVLAAASLTLNGFIAEWEDRRQEDK